MEERGAIALYLVFAVLATAGAYWALASVRSRAAGVWGALAAALFFLALGWGLKLLFQSAGIP
jgi:uncharacterized BrkB/YihY/UPF0761 family membrane protein